MPVDTGELMKALAIIANERNIQVTVKQSGKGTAICAACCFAGGLLMGPVGMALGGAAGGIAAYKWTSGTFRALGEVILNDLTDYQREQLAQHATKAIADIDLSDVPQLLALIMRNADIKQKVFEALIFFFTNELKLEIID